MLEHSALVRLDAEMGRQLLDRAAVRHPGRDVRPLPRIRALGEQAPELVDRRRLSTQDPVRVVVDEADLAQYFSK
jgi:hypothetical protein